MHTAIIRTLQTKRTNPAEDFVDYINVEGPTKTAAKDRANTMISTLLQQTTIKEADVVAVFPGVVRL